MLSPVLHKMVCGGFKESAAKRLEIYEVDQRDFEKVLDVWRGKDAVQAMELEAVARHVYSHYHPVLSESSSHLLNLYHQGKQNLNHSQ